MSGPVRARLADGRRLHLQHGPMDLIVEVRAEAEVVERAEEAAWQRFGTILDELVPQLALLRAPVAPGVDPDGSIAARMVGAVRAFPEVFLTPMAAVAGSVAEDVCAVVAAEPGVRLAYVNNGGDVALHLAEGEALTVGLVMSLADAVPAGALRIDAASPVRGLATSGWVGRSFSLGIADAVTVVAATASLADAAATVVANAVDLPGHPAVERAPARTVEPSSDLGDLEVTVAVGDLTPVEGAEALDRGRVVAEEVVAAGSGVHGVVLGLQGHHRLVGTGLDVAPLDGRTLRRAS